MVILTNLPLSELSRQAQLPMHANAVSFLLVCFSFTPQSQMTDVESLGFLHLVYILGTSNVAIALPTSGCIKEEGTAKEKRGKKKMHHNARYPITHRRFEVCPGFYVWCCSATHSGLGIKRHCCASAATNLQRHVVLDLRVLTGINSTKNI